MNDIIECPYCYKKFELSDALIHQIEMSVSKKQEEAFEERLKKVRLEVEENTRKALEEKSKKTNEENELLKNKLAEEQKEKKEAEEKVRKDEAEKFRLDRLAYEKKISDMQKSIDEAKRKGNQGSQQLQGDVLEIDLREKLKEAFQYDSIHDVPTGIRGGDIIQEVKNRYGSKAGTILWETKRQKAWNKAWLGKLKDDMRKIEASDCILVSDILPAEIKIYDRIDNVWVTSYQYAIKLVTVIRIGLINVAVAKSSASHGDEDLRKFYAIVTSDKFRHLFEKRQEIITLFKKELDADKASTERRWRRQALYIDQLASNNRDLYGMLEDHIPSLKPLSDSKLEELESPLLQTGENQDEKDTLI